MKNNKLDCNKRGVSHLQTVHENCKGFNQQEYGQAVEARKLMHIVGAPTIDNFKSMLRQNIIANCPITTKDVDNAEKIFGTVSYTHLTLPTIA